MRNLSRNLTTLAAGLALAVLTGCSTMYYNAMEKFGYQKREILVDRVQDARDEQEKAKEQFESALEEFMSVVRVEPGELEETYDRLRTELTRSETRARAVRERIDAVENVGEALFREWEAELDQYTNAAMRRVSADKLRATRARYDQLVAAMRRAETRVEPVLSAFRDQVLFLKHNLNAKAIAALQTELASVEDDIAGLIREMEASIAEADSFIREMEQE